MYCHHCGIHNTDERHQCQICEADLSQATKPIHETIYTDLTQFPYIPLLTHTLKSTHPVLWFLVVPIITVLYGVKKIAKTPFLSPLMNCKSPKLHITQIEHMQNLHKKSFETVSTFLEQYEFQPLITIEDMSMAQGMLQYISANWERTIYATVHLSKISGKVNYVTFSAFIPDNIFISVDNTHALPIQHPKNLCITHLPNASLETIYQEFLQNLAQQSVSPASLSLAHLLQKTSNLRQYIVDLGIQQHLLYVKDTPKHAPSVSMCYYHPTNVAVRTCKACGTALCEACYTEYQDQYYCQKCLPEEAKRQTSQVSLPEGAGYAGFGVRTVAALIDTALVGSFLAAIYFGVLYGLRVFLPNSTNIFIPFLITQFIAVLTITAYLIIPVKKYGRTLGQKFLGLRIIDTRNNPPETVTAIVRFAYLLLACLFVFPLLGYLFILFKKNKQGLHDRLAGTFVITKHPGMKALFSWGLLLILGSMMSWYAYQYRAALSWLSFFSSPSSYAPEIILKARWVKDFFQEESSILSYVNRGEYCIVSTPTSMYALQMQTGEIVWSVEEAPNFSLQPLSQNPTLPLLALQTQLDGNRVLFNLDPDSGEILWRQPLDIEYPWISFDAHTIVIYDYSHIYAYDMNGERLWNRRFQDQLSLDYVQLHSGVLLGRYSETSLTLTYLDRTNGEILWEMKESQYSPGYVLDKDLQIFYTEHGEAMLMSLSQPQPLWGTPQKIGHVIAHAEHPVSRDTYLYTTEAAVRKQDGTTIFSHPPHSRFGAESEDFLIILQETGARENAFILIDKYTGAIKQYIEDRTWFAVIYLSEDQSTIYLAANLKPEQSGTVNIQARLIRIDKPTLEVIEIPIGQNIGTLQFKIFSQEHFVFIPSYQRLGGYMLPET